MLFLCLYVYWIYYFRRHLLQDIALGCDFALHFNSFKYIATVFPAEPSFSPPSARYLELMLERACDVGMAGSAIMGPSCVTHSCLTCTRPHMAFYATLLPPILMTLSF